jgi:hypothetical protein
MQRGSLSLRHSTLRSTLDVYTRRGLYKLIVFATT